ncbi:transcription initiation protein SPT3 homolog [Drosophila bipectinata]|uniref:transcription initiation protein SPT3 homolog n=1 Tax=Drosophila bipectinata TaxID=42026 RepID=UPI001C895C92|nr:transcription initiation protein SPT3 homolog [Drosophila bipectinata]
MNYNAKRVMRQNSVCIPSNDLASSPIMIGPATPSTPGTPQLQTPEDIKPIHVQRQVILLQGGGIAQASPVQQQQQQQQQHQQQPQPQQHVNMNAQNSGGSAAVSIPVADDAPVSLLTEIADIMRSFGDSDQPRMASVKLVEQILQQQLRGIFNEASLVAMRRKQNPCPSQADFEFLMRNHPVKIARMRKHLKDMRILKRFLSIRTGRPQDFMDDLEQQDEDEELAIEVNELHDEDRMRRLFRADRISQILTGQQYLEFNEARKTSFYCRHGEKIKNKFRRFLDLPADLRIPTPTMNILAYLAHETIAAIVDYSILTRLNSDNRATEPYSRVTSAGGSPAMMHVCPEVTQGRGMEVVKPISVPEIHEAMRRFRQMSSRKIGRYRNSCDIDFRRSFLAI